MRKTAGSLTLQLSGFFAVAAAAVFAALGFYLFQALVAQLRERDDAVLRDRAAYIRHLLEETDSVTSVEKFPHRFVDAADLRGGILLEMRAADGHLLVCNANISIVAKSASDVGSNRAAEDNEVRDAIAVDGSQVRVLQTVGKVGDGANVVRITLVHMADGGAALLSAYRTRVLIAVIIGALLTAFIGYLVSRRSLGKVAKLADQARAITVNNLRLRLDPTDVPKELRVLAESFNDVLSRLERGFQNLSQFSADLAHDMRTPLNNLMVQTQVALSQIRAREEYEELLTSHHEEYERLVRMVETMLFLARADHDEIALTTSELDVAVELHRIAEYFEGPSFDAGIQLVASGVGVVIADALLLARAVGNLVSNAIRYTPRGCTISLHAEQSETGTSVTVSNPGLGIDERDLPQLFERFYRSDKSRSSSGTSAGLGLAIVKSIMKLHGGTAAVHSTSDRVTFTLFFPLQGARLAGSRRS